jgi:hypothetical protein
VNSLPDANDFLNAIKKAAIEAVNTSQPSDFCYGKVTGTNPLKILVEQKMTLGAAQLILTRNVTDFTTMVTVNWNTESSLNFHSHDVNIDCEDGGDPSHSHEISGSTDGTNLAHTHALIGKKSITVHNALQVGDEVILLKKKGGQKYLVLDRVVKT